MVQEAGSCCGLVLGRQAMTLNRLLGRVQVVRSSDSTTRRLLGYPVLYQLWWCLVLSQSVSEVLEEVATWTCQPEPDRMKPDQEEVIQTEPSLRVGRA